MVRMVAPMNFHRRLGIGQCRGRSLQSLRAEMVSLSQSWVRSLIWEKVINYLLPERCDRILLIMIRVTRDSRSVTTEHILFKVLVSMSMMSTIYQHFYLFILFLNILYVRSYIWVVPFLTSSSSRLGILSVIFIDFITHFTSHHWSSPSLSFIRFIFLVQYVTQGTLIAEK